LDGDIKITKTEMGKGEVGFLKDNPKSLDDKVYKKSFNFYKKEFGKVELPISFNKVSGNFNVDLLNLEDMRLFPKHVGGNLEASGTYINTLKGCPEYVGGNVVISGDLTVNGTTTTINSNITTIDDPVIELGTAGVADSFDRGIIGVYDNRKLFFGWNNSANVFTFVPDATVTSGSNIVTGTAGKAVFGEIVAGSNVTINDSTQSTNTLSGALVVGGGVGIASNVNVGGNVNITQRVTINDSTESNSITTGALQVLGGIGASGSLFTGGNLSVTKQVVYSVDSFTSISIVSTAATPLWSGSASATIKHLLPPTNAAQYYHANTSISYVTGQHMDIFFTRPAANTIATANIDFGSSNLYSGTGAAQYLVFTQPGQSASLVYLSGDDSVKGWRIINTGAQVY
jgi:hypothetical protein